MEEKKTLSSKRREEKRKKRRRALAAPFFTVLFALGIIALIIPLRPAESMREKRRLAQFPDFSVRALLSGDYFDDITLSSITGYRKPHPYIFRTALCQADLDASECAFVGDTLSRDVIGPRKMGYGLIFKINSYFTPMKDQGRNWDGVEPDYQVTDIYDVYRILKELLGK